MSMRPDRGLLFRAQQLGITPRVCQLLRIEDRAEGVRKATELVEKEENRRAEEEELAKRALRRNDEKLYGELRGSFETRMVALPAENRDEIRGLFHELFVRTEFGIPEFYQKMDHLLLRLLELEFAQLDWSFCS